MIKTKTLILVAFLLLVQFLIPVFLHAEDNTLNQYILELQNNPSDNALREKIIKYVQTMRPAPAIPEEARKHFVMAQTLQKKAKDSHGYKLTIEEYKEALLVAPWWPEAYNNMGILMEQVGQYDEAMSALKLYMLTNPKDAREAQDKIYAIEAAKKMAVSEQATEAASELKRKEEQDARSKLESVAGVWEQEYSYQPGKPTGVIWKIYKTQNNEWVVESTSTNRIYFYNIRQNGRSISFTKNCRGCDPNLNAGYYTLTLSPDGTKLIGPEIDMAFDGQRSETVWIRR